MFFQVGPRYEVMANNSLRIFFAQKDDSGFYSCYAQNDLGSAVKTVYLSVKGERHKE